MNSVLYLALTPITIALLKYARKNYIYAKAIMLWEPIDIHVQVSPRFSETAIYGNLLFSNYVSLLVGFKSEHITIDFHATDLNKYN